MKVAYLINQYPKVSHTFIRREIQALEASGVEVVRISIRPPADPEFPDPLDREESKKTCFLLQKPLTLVASAVAYLICRPRVWIGAMRAAWAAGRRSQRGVGVHLIYLLEAAYLCRVLRRSGVVHLHAHFGTNPAAVAMLARLLGGPPYSFTVHGPDEFDRAASLSLDAKARHAECVVGISQFTRSQLIRWIDNCDHSKLRLVRCGLDEGFLGEAGRVPTPDVTRLVFVGRLTVTKGILSMIEALRILKEKGVAFHIDIVGEGDQRQPLEAAIIAADLQDDVTLCGAKSSEDVNQYLVNARALVLPSFAEGLPVVVMEALALGRVVVASWVAGVPELVEHEINSLLVIPGCVESLAKAIERVLTTPVMKLDQMAALGRQKVLRNHNIRTETARLMTLFESGVIR